MTVDLDALQAEELRALADEVKLKLAKPGWKAMIEVHKDTLIRIEAALQVSAAELTAARDWAQKAEEALRNVALHRDLDGALCWCWDEDDPEIGNKHARWCLAARAVLASKP